MKKREYTNNDSSDGNNDGKKKHTKASFLYAHPLSMLNSVSLRVEIVWNGIAIRIME